MESTKSTVAELRERREEMLELLITDTDKAVTVKFLANHFDISEMTARRDLSFLEEQGLVIRFHGGARLNEEAAQSYDNSNIYIGNIRQAIAKKAAEYIEDNSSIFINSGETALNVVDYLEELSTIIVSNNLNIYKKKTNFRTTTILTGGEIRDPRDVLVGDLAVKSLKDIRSDYTILSCNGVSAEHGISTNNIHESIVNKTMIDNTNKLVIVVADFQKVGQSTNFTVDTLDHIDIVITDIYADKGEVSKMEELGITVVQVAV